jgi:hypothetical protein
MPTLSDSPSLLAYRKKDMPTLLTSLADAAEHAAEDWDKRAEQDYAESMYDQYQSHKELAENAWHAVKTARGLVRQLLAE